MKLLQQNRRVSIQTPLGPDVLVITHVDGVEELSRPFSYQIRMLSERDDIPAEQLVGQSVSIRILDLDDHEHQVNGVVRSFVNHGRGDRATIYTAEVVSWLWWLTRRTNCRIFQDLSVPRIVEQVFREAGQFEFEVSGLRGHYAQRDYCVQYRETDLDFVSRLLEEEGIFYSFRHEGGKHILVLGDDPTAYMPSKDRKARFAGPLSFDEVDDNITAWEHRYEFRSGRVALGDFNFETPQAPVRSRERTVLKVAAAPQCELYDYPGNYLDRDGGDRRARCRMEAEEVNFDHVVGSSRCRGFVPGRSFVVAAHHLPAEVGREYVVTRVRHRVDVGAYVPDGATPEGYSNDFEAIPASVPFRPARVTPRGFVRGPQTAMVVGPAGEEIHTDKHGRVKVKFPWDRAPGADEHSSCWIRVSQPWAGVGYGGLAIPRIGQEVIVDFLEGDPDRPIITGRVYNAATMPPQALPAAKVRTSLRSQTHKGKGFNELTMDDTTGQEHFYMKAQFDKTEEIGNNRNTSVGVDSMEIVGNNDAQIVSNNKSCDVTNAYNVNCDTMLINAKTSITLQCGASRIHMNQAGFISITGTVITSAAAINNSMIAPLTEVVGAAVLVEMGGIVKVVGGLTSINGGKVDVVASGDTIIQGAKVKIN